MKGDLACDPRGLIFEAYRMPELTGPDCRTIFLDWALGAEASADIRKSIETLLETYAAAQPDHPMTAVLKEGLAHARAPKRRGGRAARLN